MSKKGLPGWVLLCGLPLVLVLIYSPLLIAEGRAKWDVAHGNYHITEYGLLTGDFRIYRGLLLKRYGVHVEAGGCRLPANYQQVETYNGVVRESLLRKYHHNIFAECATASLPRHF